jgi:hypothetical protein
MGCTLTKTPSIAETSNQERQCCHHANGSCELRRQFEGGVSSPQDSSHTDAKLSSSVTRLASDELDPGPSNTKVSKPNPQILTPVLALTIEDDLSQGDEETPFSVNRLISCPDLTPTVERANASEQQGMKALTLTHARLLFRSRDREDNHVNWAEHSPITPRANLVSYRM